MRLEQEIAGGGADFLEIVNMGPVWENRFAEAGERRGGAAGVSVEAGGGGGAGDDEIVGAGGE